MATHTITDMSTTSATNGTELNPSLGTGFSFGQIATPLGTQLRSPQDQIGFNPLLGFGQNTGFNPPTNNGMFGGGQFLPVGSTGNLGQYNNPSPFGNFPFSAPLQNTRYNPFGNNGMFGGGPFQNIGPPVRPGNNFPPFGNNPFGRFNPIGNFPGPVQNQSFNTLGNNNMFGGSQFPNVGQSTGSGNNLFPSGNNPVGQQSENESSFFGLPNSSAFFNLLGAFLNALNFNSTNSR